MVERKSQEGSDSNGASIDLEAGAHLLGEWPPHHPHVSGMQEVQLYPHRHKPWRGENPTSTRTLYHLPLPH